MFSTTEIPQVFTRFMSDFEQARPSKEHNDIFSNSCHFNACDMGRVVTNTPSDTLNSYGVKSMSYLKITGLL